jgi:hypothetical protein
MRSIHLLLLATLGAFGCQSTGWFTADDDDTTDALPWGDDDATGDDDSADDDDTTDPIDYSGCISLADFPLCYADRDPSTGDYNFNAKFVVGANASAAESLAATDIAIGINGYSPDGLHYLYVLSAIMSLDSEIQDHTAENLIAVGQTNTLTELLQGNLTLPANTGRLELFLHPTGYTTLVVDGDTSDSTRLAADYVALNPDGLPDSTGAYVEWVNDDFRVTEF